MRPMTFTEAFVRAQSAPSCRYLTYWQTRCDQELTRVYRAAFPLRKLPRGPDGQPNARLLPHLKAELAPGYTDAYAQYQALAEKIVARQRRAWKGWQTRLDVLAEQTPVEPGESRVVWEHWASTWSTQGYGAERYAQGAAEGDADKARYYDIPVEVVRVSEPFTAGHGAHVKYQVRCAVSEVGAEVLKRRSEPSLREWVRLCWKRGVNPRVYSPFLPEGYEERAGLDYFGGERSST